MDDRPNQFAYLTPDEMAFEDYSEYEHSYRMGVLLEGPNDEHDLAELFRSPFSPPTNMNEIEYGYYSLISYDDITIEMCEHVPPRPMLSAKPQEEEATTVIRVDNAGNEEDEEKEDQWREGAGSTRMVLSHQRRRPTPTTAPREEGDRTSSIVDLLDHTQKSRSGTRGRRKRGTWSPNHFLLHRINNKHWTRKEVKLLVEGVSELGTGHWTELKARWFSDSDPVQTLFSEKDPVRTAMHLKDKWRNLVRAYVFRPTSKKKGSEPLDKDLIKKIQMLAAEHPYPK